MPALLTDTATVWWQWMTSITLFLGLMAVVAWMIDLLFGRRIMPQLMLALWGAVLLRVLLPTDLSSAFSLTAQLDLPSSSLPSAPGVAGYLFAAWAVGMLVFAGIWLYRHRRQYQGFIETANPALSPDIDALCTATAKRLGLGSVPRVIITDIDYPPAVIGAARPLVVLPARLLSQPRIAVEHLLLHEFMHIRRRDPWLRLAVISLSIMFWFNPLMLLIRRRITAWTESCCDADVKHLLGGSSHGYRRTLLNTAALRFGLKPQGVSALDSGGHLFTRLKALQQPVVRHYRIKRRLSSLAVPGMLILGLAAPPLPALVQYETIVASPPPGCLTLRYAVLGAMAATQNESQPSSDQ